MEDQMNKRPYFRYSGEELKALFTESKDDIDTLTALKFELSHRKYSKSRLLETEIEKLITSNQNKKIYSEKQSISSSPYNTEATVIQVKKLKAVEPEPIVLPNTTLPERYIVECEQCKTPNFLYALDDKVQYLSCSNCKTSFEVQFKQGVMRTTFHTRPQAPSQISFKTVSWLIALVAALVFTIYLFM
jgi:hypothetical protein